MASNRYWIEFGEHSDSTQDALTEDAEELEPSQIADLPAFPTNYQGGDRRYKEREGQHAVAEFDIGMKL